MTYDKAKQTDPAGDNADRREGRDDEDERARAQEDEREGDESRLTAYWLPTRPYGVIDAINRCAAATGSPRYAMLASGANYNGHRVSCCFNDYRHYWVTEYYWAGRVVLARGDFGHCLDAGIAEHARGALGATFVVVPKTAEETALCEARGLVPYSTEVEAAHFATWCTPLHAEVGQAMRYERQFGCPAVGFLANSKTVEEYKAQIEAHFAEQRTAMAGAR